MDFSADVYSVIEPPDAFAEYAAGFCSHRFCGGKGKEKSSRSITGKSSETHTTKIPDIFLQIGRAKVSAAFLTPNNTKAKAKTYFRGINFTLNFRVNSTQL